MRKRTHSIMRFSISVLILCSAGAGWAATLSGRVYEGQTGTEPPPSGNAKSLIGVTVSLYGSDNAGDDGTGGLPIQMTTTNSEGWYSLTVRGAYDFYNIVQTNLATHVDSTPSPAATSVGGTVKSSNWIQYRYEDIFITPLTTTGNKFWDEPISSGNNPPVANDDSVTIVGLGPIYVLDNDSDPDGDGIRITSTTDPPHGEILLIYYGGHGGIVYQSDVGFTGIDTFEYTISDGKGGTDTATVTITVQAPSPDAGTLNGHKRDADTGAGLPGWKIYVDQNLNGQWDLGEPYDLTDGTGYYEIPNLAEGTYRVCEVMQAGWEPAGGGTACVEGITIAAGTITTQDFHNRTTEEPEDECDFGDAPDPTYPTLLASNGARHRIDPGVFLGMSVESDPDGQSSPDAQGDDADGADDEDGVAFTSPLAPGAVASITVTASVPGLLYGWIDFQQDGQFDMPDDYVFSGQVLHSGVNILGMQIPANAVPGGTYARFRFSENSMLDPHGPAPDGEVEDYLVEIRGAGAGSVVIIKEASPQDDTSFSFCVDYAPGGFFDTLCQTLRDPSGAQWSLSNLDLLETVSETVAGGWVLTDITITGDADNGSVVDLANATVDVDFDEGENIVIVFKNEKTGAEADDFGDAPTSAQSGFPASYPSASHQLGGPYLGLFGDAPDAESDMQRDTQAAGDDNDADGDDENGLLSINLVKAAGVWSSWEIKGCFNSSSDAKFGVWLDLNGDGDWDDSGELLSTFGFCGFPTGPQDWFHAMGAFPLSSGAKVGTTYMRLRVYNDCNATVSPSGAAGPGEVEDYAVEIKAGGPGLPPGGIVHGYKWNDINGNGLWDILNPVEPPLAGWTIWLDMNGNGMQDAGDMTTQTDAQGHFRFTGVPAGTYTLGEQLQAGWVQTMPGGTGTYAVTVQPGQASLPQMFGNRQGDGPGPGMQFDWGDAPDPSYPTLRSNNGAYHAIVSGLHLGVRVDPEPDGQPSPNGLGDDHFDADDEDGVFFATPILPGDIAVLEIFASAPGFVDAWIDFAGDGTWMQSADRILASEPVMAGSNMLTIAVPASARSDIPTHARFRLTAFRIIQ